jgi:Mg-chelatase subunit ChlD
MTVPESLNLSCRVNRTEVPQIVSSDAILLTSLQAIEENAEEKRNPVNIVIVLDRSASMASSNKLELCKKTIAFLCKEALNENDRIGLVTFDSDAQVVYPRERMTEENKNKFLQKLNALKVGDHTNLSAGLFQGLQSLQELSVSPSEVTAILLLSDGEITSGITDRKKLVRMANNVLATFPSEALPSVHCFAYGDTFDEVLRDIARATEGGFYHVANVEQIPLAFADTLGGLLHVAAQNVEITIEISGGGAEIDTSSTITKYPIERLSGCACKIRINDIYMGERRDVLVRLKLPCVSTAFTIVDCRVSVRYIDIVRECIGSMDAYVAIKRVANVSDTTEDAEVKRHLMRVEAANALDEARIKAEAGDIGSSRKVIEEKLQDTVKGLKDMRIDENHDVMMRDVLADLRTAGEVLKATKSAQSFKAGASREMESAMWSHSHQRSNNITSQTFRSIHTPEVSLDSAYETRGKGDLVKKAKAAFGLT